MHTKILLLTLSLSLSLSLLPLSLQATPCDQATMLVIQAYDLGHNPSVYAQKKQQLQHALKLCPNHPDAHNNLAVILENEQHYTQAIHHYQRTLQIDPDYYDAWIGIGDAYYKQGQFPLSLEAYLHACPRDKYARQRVTALFDKNRYRTAEKGNVLKKESLSLLYDKTRLQNLHQMVKNCRSRYRLVINTDSLLDTFAVFRNIHFEVGKYTLSTQIQQQLDDIASTLLGVQAQKMVIISGHTDVQPYQGLSRQESDRRNWKLSQERAAAIATALVKRGVPRKNLETRGFGYSQPAQGYTMAEWDKNRRVEIEVK